MKRSWGRWLFGGLFLALLVWLGFRVEWGEQEFSQITDEARRQPYLAAQRFLERQGVEISVAGLPAHFAPGALTPPESDGVLVLIDALGQVPPERAQEVLDWVEQGGRLMLNVSNPFGTWRQDLKDAFLDYFGVVATRLDEPEELPEWLEFAATLSGDNCRALNSPVELYLGDHPDLIRVAFAGRRTLILDPDSDAEILNDDAGIRLARFYHGDGEVIISAGIEPWHNRFIGCYDHAYLLASWLEPGDRVRVLIHRSAPSIWALLWQGAWLALVAGAFGLGLLLWRQAVRFGPLLPPPEPRRRRLLEHVDAAAGFLWRRHGHGALLEPVRQELHERAKRRLVGFARWPRQRQAEELARLGGLTTQQVYEALYGTAGDEDGFVRCIQTLQTLREKL